METNSWENKIIPSNKWEGEDEEDDVKDSWDADDDVEEEPQPKSSTVAASKKPKKLAEKIEERERKDRMMKEELQRKIHEKEITKDMSPEERLAEKLRRQRLVEESDLENTKALLGVTDLSSIDSMEPESKLQFEKFESLLTKKISSYSKSEHFPSFIEELTRNVCVHLNSADIKKIKMNLDNMHIEKMKMEKGDKPKKNKGKGKAKLKLEAGNEVLNDEYSAYAIDDNYDDFI